MSAVGGTSELHTIPGAAMRSATSASSTARPAISQSTGNSRDARDARLEDWGEGCDTWLAYDATCNKRNP